MKSEIKYLSKIEINGLWERLNIEWNLNSNVNVLSGINGSGKTTILDCIYSLINSGTPPQKLRSNIKNIKITFNNGKSISYDLLKVTDTIKNIEKFATKDFKYKAIINNIREERGSEYNKINKVSVEMGITSLDSMKIEELNNILNIDVISTFDNPLLVSESLKKLSVDDVKTELDFEIYLLQKKYLDYQLNIGKKAFESISKGANTEEIAKIKNNQERFLEIIDELFQQTGKKINRDKNEIDFLLEDNSNISVYKLSSGEKQMLVILLTVLTQDNKPSILFMDEPEISLHFDWQKKLIQYIRELNPNAQIILATHSPAVIMEGWLDKVSEVSDLIKNKM